MTQPIRALQRKRQSFVHVVSLVIPLLLGVRTAGATPALEAYEQSVSAVRDHPVTVPLCGACAFGGNVAFRIEAAPQHGALGPLVRCGLNFATVSYTPPPGFTGEDVFLFAVGRAGEWSAPARVVVQVGEFPRQLPEGCPHVVFNDNRNLVVDGEKLFPIGFFCLQRNLTRSDLAELGAHFNAMHSGGSAADRLAITNDAGLYLAATYVLILREGGAGRSYFDTTWLRDQSRNPRIIAWEVAHEPTSYRDDDLRADVALQARLIRETDVCARPVVVCPEASAGERFTQYARDADLTIVQAYGTPYLPLLWLRKHIERVRDRLGDHPFICVHRIEGYQPMRYRVARREPTFQEVRATVYQSVVLGASGIWWYPHAQTVVKSDRRDFQELPEARYLVTDSPVFYDALKRIADEVRRMAPLFLAVRDTATAAPDDSGVCCAMRDLNGTLPGGEYLICVNVAEDRSTCFYYNDGNTEQIEAFVSTTTNQVLPADAPAQRVLPMSADRLYLQPVNADVSNRDLDVNRVAVHFAAAPAGARFRFAVYSDQLRDLSPDQREYLSPWYAVPADGGWVERRVLPPVTMEHTREYFVAVTVDRAGVKMWGNDPRRGPGPQPGTQSLDQHYPPLVSGRSADATITLTGGPWHAYNAVRTPDAQQCTGGTITDGTIVDAFEPYAVHVYQLVP